MCNVLAPLFHIFTEHAEEWRFHTGEKVLVRFCSVHEFRGEEIVRWWDYPDLDALLNNAPKWWLDHIMEGYEGGPSPSTLDETASR